MSERPPLPAYGTASLSEAMPSILAAVGVPGFSNVLGLEPAPAACLLLIDGLGWEQVRRFADAAPFLGGRARETGPITASFPSTTASSLGSLGTGLPPGEHGLVGYTFAVPGHDRRAMNALQWSLYGSGPGQDLRTEFPSERFQPEPTVFERARDAGTEVAVVGHPDHARSGLTRAVLRGGRFLGAHSLGDQIALIAGAMADGARVVYAYHADLDVTGHARGVGSDAWLEHLSMVDRLVQAVAGRLPDGAALFVTGDHGMVNLQPEDRIEIDDHPDLAAGVRLVAGEGRARHVYAHEGAEADVLAAWREALEDRMWVASRERAIEDGWFGPRVIDRVRPRIGDVVAAARGPVGIFQRAVDSTQPELLGHHGSMTREEQLVPFLDYRK